MILMIGVAGALGACARYYISVYYSTKNRSGFPIATFLVNITGSLFLGGLFSLYERTIITQSIWLLLGVGFLGAFTTFSTFSYEWIISMQQKQYYIAVQYMVASVSAGLAAVYIGFWMFK